MKDFKQTVLWLNLHFIMTILLIWFEMGRTWGKKLKIIFINHSTIALIQLLFKRLYCFSYKKVSDLLKSLFKVIFAHLMLTTIPIWCISYNIYSCTPFLFCFLWIQLFAVNWSPKTLDKKFQKQAICIFNCVPCWVGCSCSQLSTTQIPLSSISRLYKLPTHLVT